MYMHSITKFITSNSCNWSESTVSRYLLAQISYPYYDDQGFLLSRLVSQAEHCPVTRTGRSSTKSTERCPGQRWVKFSPFFEEFDISRSITYLT